MWSYNYSSELYHHGIKGQKWGVRRFQNKNGGLTNAGRKRYADSDGGEKKSSNKPKKTYKIPEKKSEHRLKLEAKYQKEGMNAKDAEQAAAKRIRAEKFAVGAAAMTVAAASAYCAYKGYSTDRVLSDTTEFQRIARSKDGKTMREQNAYYVSYKKGDNKRYEALYGKQLKGNNWTNAFNGEKEVYKFKGKAENQMKVASSKRARDTFAKMYKENAEFRNLVNNSPFAGVDAEMAGRGKLANVKLKGKVYDKFNQGLVGKDEASMKSAKMFYDELKKQGMNAVQDVNDRKFSGYSTKDPLIVFDNKINFDKSSKVTDEFINKNFNKELGKGLGIHLAKKTPKTAAVGGALYVANNAANKQNKKTIDKLRSQGLTDKEIAARLGLTTKQYIKMRDKLDKKYG